MEKRMIRGREMYLGVSTEELIAWFKENPSVELETSGGITRWLRFNQTKNKIGITDDIRYTWFTIDEFRQCYGSWYWNFFVM